MQGWGEASVHPFLVHNYHRPQGGKFSALPFEGNSSFSDKPWTRSKPATFATFPGGVTAGSQVSAVPRAPFWGKNWDTRGRRGLVGPGRARRCVGDLGLPSFQAHGDFLGAVRGLEGRA